jgi:flagellar basal body-associated protein FliL
MDKDAPSHRSALRDNKNVLVASLIFVILMFVGALIFAIFFASDDERTEALSNPTPSPNAYPSTTPTNK